MSAVPLTDTEQEILLLVLREMRKANARKEQLSILVSPFLVTEGAHVTVAHSAAGFTQTLEGKIRTQSRRPRRTRRRTGRRARRP